MKIFSRLTAAPRGLSAGLAAAAVLLGACSQTPVTVTLHSLQASGSLSFVCQADDGTGLQLDACPDYENGRRRILGLVTQTATDEVAVVDLRGEAVLDLDPSTPGYTFARVGARPGAIVSSPGGRASFVGVTGLQKNGVFALPTTCLNPPKPGELTRDLTSWSACALSSAPGDIRVLVDAAGVSCPAPAAASQADRECPADLTTEGGAIGRRKLLVALPDEHKLVLLDAQHLLDSPPGQFQACAVEASYPLTAVQPTGPVEPVLPDDLQIPSDVASANVCQTTQYPAATATEPTPGGMAQSGSALYVADRSLPVVHVLDVTDPCSPIEQAPLLPHSYVAPSRVVTTSRVAVSPLTPAGKQYVYAVDDADQPTASLMVFDVSAGVTNRTPLIFPGAPRQPYSSPDRIIFSAPVRDVSVVMRDFPAPDPVTGIGQFGLACNPDPAISQTSPGALYQPNSDYTSGARPPNLRGVFAFAMLTNGQIPIIDVEDFDAPCRRPVATNSSPFPDFRGCKSDPPDVPYYTQRDAQGVSTANGVPTVTNEVTCNIVEPNRTRSSGLAISNAVVGLRAPTLRALPQFSNPDPAAVITPQDQPHMLAVDFANADPNGKPFPAQVNVSSQLYASCPNGTDQAPPCDGTSQVFETDPLKATQSSLTLPLIEPRSYAAAESPTLTFEGRVLPGRTSGFLQQESDGSWLLRDQDAGFCATGVEDSNTILTEAAELGIPAASQPAWAAAHADYVQITGDFLGVDDAYWTSGRGSQCGASGSGTTRGRDACITEFGDIDNPAALKNTRELSIVRAFSDRLVVTGRNGNRVDDVQCCFPTGTPYAVRASHQWLLSAAAGLHDIASATDGSCVHTAACDPRKKYFHSRVFEVCDSSAAAPDGTADADECVPGAANVGCVRAFSGTDAAGAAVSNGAIEPGSEGSQCIFENLTARFAVYRGVQPSTRDMSFSWSTTGGFAPLAMSLATVSTSVNPQSMVYLPELGYMAVIDGSSLGLTLFDLNSLGVVTPSPFF